MPEKRDQGQLPIRRSSKFLKRAAIGSLFFPLLITSSLYGQWLVATWKLGHFPLNNLSNDPAESTYIWMHVVTTLFILGTIPATLTAFVLNIIDLKRNPSTRLQRVIRISLSLVSWSILYVLFYVDPGEVLSWWLDL